MNQVLGSMQSRVSNLSDDLDTPGDSIQKKVLIKNNGLLKSLTHIGELEERDRAKNKYPFLKRKVMGGNDD